MERIFGELYDEKRRQSRDRGNGEIKLHKKWNHSELFLVVLSGKQFFP